MKGKYEAVGVHFHWGNATNKGSEHMIDNRRYDVEMHIVHKNVAYDTVEEATQHKDGLAVLGIMFKIVNVSKICVFNFSNQLIIFYFTQNRNPIAIILALIKL